METNAANIFETLSPALTQPGSAFADLPIPAWNRNCQEKAKAVKQIEEWEKKKKVANPYKTKYVFSTPPKESASVAHFFYPLSQARTSLIRRRRRICVLTLRTRKGL